MSTHKNIDKICIVVIILALILTVLFMNGKNLGLIALVDEDAENYEGDEYFSANDLNGSWDTSEATVITLNGDSAGISGDGAYSYDGDVYIAGGGYYVLSGSLTDGNIVVDAYSSSKVWILFDGVDIYCSDNAGLIVNEAEKVFLTLAEGSENSISTGAEYSESAIEDGAGGAVFAHDDLTINGSGSLIINTEYNHGIEANDELRITGGNIEITAVKDGINVNESFRYTDATLTINAGSDGISAGKEIIITGGTILVNECYEGLEAPAIEVEDGDITIYFSDDGFNATDGSGSTFGMQGGGMMQGGRMPQDGEMPRDGEMPEDGQMPEGGRMHGGHGMGNRSDMSQSTEEGDMPEGPDMSEEGENMQMPDNVVKSDFSNMEKAGVEENTESGAGSDGSEESAECYIKISGGNITLINKDGRDVDGMDSNGSIYISGGNIYIDMPNTAPNEALDCGTESGGTCEITGGTVEAPGFNLEAYYK